MLFADNPHDRQIEKLMSQIPNFKPRGHGIYIYEEKEYSAENCFCRECTYRRKKKRNSKTAPPCIEQRIRAGEVPLGEVLQETMLAITHPAFKSRLKEYIYETEIIQLCLAISNQALHQKGASRAKTQSPNEKYTFRTWLLRLGMIGDEFKTARTFLLEKLEGNIAWRDPAQAEAQKERLR